METENKKLKYLYICAHPDDDMLVGGTMKRLVDSGWDVYELVCTTAKNAISDTGEGKEIRENRINETRHFCKILGVNDPIILDPAKRLFGEDEAVIMQVAKAIREIRPDVVALMNRDDYHFEHTVSHDIGKRAFEIAYRKTQPELGEPIKTGILVQTDGLNVLPNPLITFNTSDSHEAKISATEVAYENRVDEYLRNFVNGLALLRGSRVGYKYAECYDLLNPTWYKFKPENSSILHEFVCAGNGGSRRIAP